MKKAILAILLLIAASDTYAQKASGTDEGHGNGAGPSPTEETPAKLIYRNGPSIDYITMDVQKDFLLLDNVPNLNSIRLHITDAKGNERMSQKIETYSNKVNIARLPKGLYFVTIVSENSDNRKAFTFSKE